MFGLRLKGQWLLNSWSALACDRAVSVLALGLADDDRFSRWRAIRRPLVAKPLLDYPKIPPQGRQLGKFPAQKATAGTLSDTQPCQNAHFRGELPASSRN